MHPDPHTQHPSTPHTCTHPQKHTRGQHPLLALTACLCCGSPPLKECVQTPGCVSGGPPLLCPSSICFRYFLPTLFRVEMKCHKADGEGGRSAEDLAPQPLPGQHPQSSVPGGWPLAQKPFTAVAMLRPLVPLEYNWIFFPGWVQLRLKLFQCDFTEATKSLKQFTS